MKEKDLYIESKEQQMILYAEKEDESYGEIATGSYATKHHLPEFIKYKETLDTELRKELMAGKISPLYYFMLMQDMGPGDLAKRVGVNRWKFKKQMKPENFDKLGDKILEKYALVFGVSIERIKELKTH
ncbi:MAG: hypothetical protein KBC43_11225 [Bacteroidales bacterium]|nr:hypothetical protein [Bacteroidales bacterium]